MNGSYVLLIRLREEQTITTGSLGTVYFPEGYYAYVGSAMGGFRARLSRHLKSSKRLHWHIDYLLQKASITGAVLCETKERVECQIAKALSRRFDAIPGFGCSDCRCRSHLFLAPKEMEADVMSTVNRLGMKPLFFCNTAHPAIMIV